MPPESMIERAASLAPRIAASADWSEQNRRQAPEVATELAEAGLHRSGVPACLGGLDGDPITMMRVIEEVSAADGAAGWTLMIGIEVMGVASGFLAPETLRTILADKPSTIMAGAINPVGTAIPAEGGFVVSGQWPFGSGVHNADWWWGGCLVDDGTDRRPRRFIQAMVPADDVTILDTWDVSGLAGSGSHDVLASGVFVPESHLTDLEKPNDIDHPIFRMPTMARLAFNKVGVATGIARSALSSFVELASAKTPRGERTSLALRPRAQLAIAEATAAFNGGRSWALDVVEEMWAEVEAGRPVSDELHARVRLSCSNAVQQSVRAVEMVHAAAGSSANFRSSPLERQFRDVHVVPQQITVAPHMIEAAGRVLLGLDPDLAAF